MHAPFVPGRSDRWRWLFLDLRDAHATQWLVGLCLAVQLVYAGWLAASPQDPLAQAAVAESFFGTFGLTRAGLLGGQAWRLVTHAFLHGGAIHLLVNATMLLAIGSRVERIGGAATVLKIFFAGVVVGGLVQTFLAGPGQRDQTLVGASGGAVALLLWLVTVSPESRMWPVPVSGRSLAWGILIAEGALLALSWLEPAAMQPAMAIAHGCHFGGALTGWWLARRLLRPAVTLADLKRERARRETAGGPRE